MADQQPLPAPLPEQQQQGLKQTPYVIQLRQFLQVRRDAALKDLGSIQAVTTDEDYESAEATLATAKKLYDVMTLKRKMFTDPIKKQLEELTSYENTINYNAKSPNEYLRVRALLDQYNQKKVDEKKVAEHEAWIRSEQMKYKAEYKAKVAEQLTGKINGLYKNVIQQMSDWEKGLKLETVDQSYDKLRQSNPSLKMEHYDSCFYPWKARPDIMGVKQEEEYLVELKKELTYEAYNEKFQQLVAPVKNEYLARIDHVKAALKMKAQADEATRKKLEADAEAERQRKMAEEIKAADARRDEELKAVKDQLDIDKVEADFTQQMMTADIDAGPTKTVARFANDAQWLNAFLKVVAKCAAHPKFKFYDTKKGYRPEIAKWLEFYGANIGEPMEGIVLEERAKTIVRAKE